MKLYHTTIFYREIFCRSVAKNRKVIPFRGSGATSKTGLAHREFCIGKFPTGRSGGATSKTGLEHKEFPYEEILHKEVPYTVWGRGATSKTGLAHREFPYMEILHRETSYREKWRHF